MVTSNNKLVWVGVGLLGVMVVVAIINSNNDTKAQTTSTQAQHAQVVGPKKSTAADGDTVAETIREVQARYDDSILANKALKESNERMERRLSTLEGKRSSSIKMEADPEVEMLKSRLSEMQDDFKVLSNNLLKKTEDAVASTTGYEVSGYDLGWTDTTTGGAKGSKKGQEQSVMPTLPGYASVRPMSRTQLAANTSGSRAAMALGNSLSAIKESADNVAPLKNTLAKGKGSLVADVKPYYTIPARGTIFEATAMTALIGTVPLGGRVQDPFPAKFIVGSENLATNGLNIPGLKGIVFEGVARGNWNLSCVSVTLTAATYTFSDGRIQHMQYEQKQGGGSRDTKTASPFSDADSDRGIGYITNPQGIPCIPGQRVTDAHKQLFTMGVLGAAKSYFDAKAAAETTSSTNALGGGSTTVTGNQEAFVNNSTYGDSISTVMDFYGKRMRDTFDVIYVDPAAKVSMNITQDLLIDYHSDARKLAYATGGDNDVVSMD